MSQTVIKIGPADHGRRMSLDDFDATEATDGGLYELSRGIITVVDVPRPKHGKLAFAARRQFHIWLEAHPQKIEFLATSGECKILVAGYESERHPDLAVYTTPEPDDPNAWSIWIPAIVVEIVSLGSEQRDYVEKRDEYLAFGVQEYWIIDPAKGEMLVLRRFRGRWTEQVVRPPQRYASRLFPGFEFDIGQVLAAGE